MFVCCPFSPSHRPHTHAHKHQNRYRPPRTLEMMLSTGFPALLLGVVVSLALLRLPTAHAQADSNFGELLRVDCQGNLQLLPSHGTLSMGLSSALINKVYNFTVNMFASRVQCYCPNAQPSQIYDYFGGNMETFLRALQDPNPQFLMDALTNTCPGLKGSMKSLQNKFSFGTFPCEFILQRSVMCDVV